MSNNLKKIRKALKAAIDGADERALQKLLYLILDVTGYCEIHLKMVRAPAAERQAGARVQTRKQKGRDKRNKGPGI